MSVDVGQAEAGRSLGLGYLDTMRFIVVPQAFKNILPSLGNEFITLFKDTSLVNTIGLTELTFPASVTSIGYSAFGGCNQVTVITFKGETPPTCDSNSFSIGDPTDFQIVVPSGSDV